MNKPFKEMCLRVLADPADSGAMDRLIKLLRAENAQLADHVATFRSTGQTYPFGFVWSEDMVKAQGVQYIVVRVIPKAVAVRFACECAKRALPFIEEAYPSEDGPRELIGLVEDWTSRKVTKKAVQEKLKEVQEFASKIDREWHVAYGEGQFDTLPKSLYGKPGSC